jgi:exonuclease VII small subunit
MKLKSLLFMVTLLLCCLGVRAQGNVVFEEHFVTEPTDPSAKGFYEFINSKGGDTRAIDNGELVIFNNPDTVCRTERWQRAVKFRNLPLKEGIYRLDFKLKGSTTYKDGEEDVTCKLSTLLMQGEDNADISLLDYNGAEQRLEAEAFQPNEYVNYSKKFIFASEAQQKEAYTKGDLADKFFLTLSVYNPGTFYLKDVVLTETDAVATAEFGYSAIKISFCGATNIADMAKADPRGYVVFDDLSYATVTIDGVAAKVEAIEYREDGCLYIFTDPLEVAMNYESVVAVSFTNPTDDKQIKFNGKIESEASIFNFETVAPTYTAALDNVFSNLWLAPAMVASNPQKNSFAINPQLGEFSFTFDRKVETAGIVAVLDRGGEESNLILKAGQDEYAETVEFVRDDNGVLAKSNTITLTNVLSEKGISSDDPYVVSFEAGKPKVAKEIYTPVQLINFDSDNLNTVPVGWTLVVDYVNEDNPGQTRESGSAQGSGPRLMKPGSFYVRTGTENAKTMATFGNIEGKAVTLPVGDLRIQFLGTGYKAAGQKVLCEVLDATGQNVLVSEEHYMENVTADGAAINVDEADKITLAYNNATEQNAIIRYTVFQGSGMTETILGGVNIYTYEKTPGDVPDDKVIINETFAKWNNITPEAESGWFVYDGGNRLAPSAGGGSRIIACNGTPIKQAYFCRNFGGNMTENPGTYMTYGEAESGKTLTLEKGVEYEMTYYVATWNDEGGEIGGFSQAAYAILDSKGNVVATATENIRKDANAHNNAGTAFVADTITCKFTPSATGDYVLKFWGSNCTLACGNITFIQPGSRAVKYYSLLATAVENAKATLEKVADPMYDGATKTALEAAVAMYEDPDQLTMTTEEEFKAAIDEVEGLTKSMLTRYEYIPRFKTAYSEAAEVYLSAVGTKYEKLDCYPVLEDILTTYEDVDPSDLEDEELVGATTSLENNTALFKNMRDVCVGLLTNQIVGLANQLVALDESMVNDPYVQAASEAVTDDQEIAYQLKLRVVKAIYDMCAAGDPFVKEVVVDEETGATEKQPVEIDVTNFIQNAGFYSTGTWPATVTDFPGWTIEKIQGNFGPSYGTASWGGERATALKPVVEASIRTDWGTHEYDAQQLIDVIPVAMCTASIIVGEDGTDPHEAYGYIVKDSLMKKYYDGQNPGAEDNSYSRDTNIPREFAGLTLQATDEDGIYSSLLLGAHARVNAAFARVDNAALKLTGKVEGFDYAAAAAKLAEIIGGGVLKGDANGDGEVNITDVSWVLDDINGVENEGFNKKAADVNNDGEVNITDVALILDIINGVEPNAEN